MSAASCLALARRNFTISISSPTNFAMRKEPYVRKTALRRWGTSTCFKQTDLYTTRFGAWQSTEIEQFFFGRVDTQGREAIEYFATFEHPSVNSTAFHHLLNYMSIKKN
jgi:hypothetical protein